MMFSYDEYPSFERACVAAAANVLEGATTHPRRRGLIVVEGRYQGHFVEVRLQHVSVKGSGHNMHTYVRALLPVTGIEIDLRPFDERLIGHALLVDVELGDGAFDRYFQIDGAPSDAVRALLDAPTRARIMRIAAQCKPGWSTDNVKLQITSTGVLLAHAGGLPDPRSVHELLQLTTSIASRTSTVSAAISADPVRAARSGAELAALRAGRRAQNRRGWAVLALVLTLVFGAIGGIVYLFSSVRIEVPR